jgi:DNA invertase Pin-like site-specific DNA recombinase
MKDPMVVPSGEQHQRKEVRRKEKAMPKPNQHETDDQEKPRRAAIYLSEAGADKEGQRPNAPSIDQQRRLCRYAATVLNAEVVAEYVEEPVASRFSPGMLLVLKLVGQKQRIDYLIVSSWDRLAGDHEEAFEVALHLEFEGTTVIAVDEDDRFAWTRPS